MSSDSDKALILFLAANPRDTPWVSVDKEMRAIIERLKKSKADDLFELKSAPAVRATDLQSILWENEPRIVHFSCHGSEEGELIFEGDGDESVPISAELLRQIFRNLTHKVFCVILTACFAKQQAEALLEFVPCAIGTRRRISDKAAAAFSAGFYEALAFRKSLQVAFDAGCVAIEAAQLRNERDVPLLLHRSGINPSALFLFDSKSSPDARAAPKAHGSSAGTDGVPQPPPESRKEQPSAQPASGSPPGTFLRRLGLALVMMALGGGVGGLVVLARRCDPPDQQRKDMGRDLRPDQPIRDASVRPPPQSPEDAAHPRGPVTITVTSAPPGVQIFVDGRLLGNTPTTIVIMDPSRSHQIVLKNEGYSPWQRVLEPGDDLLRPDGPMPRTLFVPFEGNRPDKQKPLRPESSKRSERAPASLPPDMAMKPTPAAVVAPTPALPSSAMPSLPVRHVDRAELYKELKEHPEPRLPAAVSEANLGKELSAEYQLCFDAGERVPRVSVVRGIRDADESIMATLREWRIKPSAAPVCSKLVFLFNLGVGP